MIVVTHEMGFARHVSNHVIFLDQGKIEWDNFTDSCIIPFHRDKSARIYTGLYFELKGNI